jgi:hypothetical protein
MLNDNVIFHLFMPPKPKPTSATAVPIVIVERNGDLRSSQIDAYDPMELCKKCKYKTPAGFEIRAEWAYSGADERFMVELWAREDGNAGQENKYEFPPPVDTILFFGACALVAKDMSSQHRVIPLTLEKWDKMYDFLFGGFDTLANCEDDDDEEDELDAIPASKKTKDGYLKDGFVVDTSGEDDDEADEDEDDEDDEDDTEDDTEDDDDDDIEADDDDTGNAVVAASTKIPKSKQLSKRRDKKQPKEEILVDTSSELSEEAYEYFDD